jgi:hypothetical protein
LRDIEPFRSSLEVRCLFRRFKKESACENEKMEDFPKPAHVPGKIAQEPGWTSLSEETAGRIARVRDK